MPIVRTFRGRLIKRTKKKAKRIVVIFHGEDKGLPGQQIELPLADFLAERRVDYRCDSRSQS